MRERTKVARGKPHDLQQGTSDGQSTFVVRISRDRGATWDPLESMGVAQSIPTAFKATYGFLLEQGYGRPETRRLRA